MDIKRLQHTLNKINQFTKPGRGINRLAYTDTELQARNYLIGLFKEQGMSVRVDAVGNVIARREGTNPNLPAVALGSHIDSVYEAGKFDGTVGVVAALEVIRSLNDESIETEYPIEVICFACEESARFGISTFGSKAIAGAIEKSQVADFQDKNGITLEKALENNGLSLKQIETARRSKADFHSFIELHIEQGPVLERERKQIGIVTAIAGPTRFKVEIIGGADHSGTTPMDYRKDALLGSAEIALALEEAALKEIDYKTVATVGDLTVMPGAMNVIPGRTELKVDIRGIDVESKKRVIAALKTAIANVTEKRDLEITLNELSDELPVDMDKTLMESLQTLCEEATFDYVLMPSGAGHDAMNMAKLCPTALIFIPSKDGLSHNPDELTTIDEIAIGAELLEKHVLLHAKAYKKEMKRA